MNILVIGGGGREHAIVWKLSQLSKVNKLYCMPGNGGIGELAELNSYSHWAQIGELVTYIERNNIDLTVVGPEAPLVKGVVDGLKQNGKKAFGPNCKASLLEGSKVWCKDFLKRHKISTADYRVFKEYSEAEKYVKDRYVGFSSNSTMQDLKLVIKADGLAAGKGVFIIQSAEEGIKALQQCMVEKIFGDAGKQVVIEECLEGREVSLLAFTDGKTIIPMVSAQDYKRAYDHDEGPNTGGMGCISPSPILTPALQDKIMKKVMYPTLEGLQRDKIIYIGVLYAGLMLVDDEPYVLEFNCRFGDPETQVILPRLKTDLLEIMLACVEQKLDQIKIEWEDNAAVCVVLASGGYPGEFKKGYPITGLENFPMNTKDTNPLLVFHAGTDYRNGKIVSMGGRVLNVVAVDKDIPTARKRVYEAIPQIQFEKMQYRGDIGIDVK